MIDQASLQAALSVAHRHLAGDRESALRAAGLPSGLAYLSLPLLQLLAGADDQGEVSDLLLVLVGKPHRRAILDALADPTAALHSLDGASPLGQACKALLKEMSPDATARAALDAQMSISAGNDSTISSRMFLTKGDLYYLEAPPDPLRERQERALLAYLRRIRGDCEYLPLDHIDHIDAIYAHTVKLTKVYIDAETPEWVILTETQRRRQTVIEALTQAEQARLLDTDGPDKAKGRPDQVRLLLTGKPGSGKSMFVNHLALCLAGAALCERENQESQPEGGWLACLPGWTFGALHPIRVNLYDFAEFAPLKDVPRGSLGLLLNFVEMGLKDSGCGDALEILLTALNDGNAILLLDGFDNQIGTPKLERITESIIDAAHTYTRIPIVVTRRILENQTERPRPLLNFSVQTVAELNGEQIDRFITKWYDNLAISCSLDSSRARNDARTLREALNAHTELRDLAQLPLVLTTMVAVHTSKRTLPDARALLYLECIKLLLSWYQPRCESDLRTRLGLNLFSSSDLLALLARLGFAAHELAERKSIPDPWSAELIKLEAMRLLAEGFEQFDKERRFALAELTLNILDRGNGLLLQYEPDKYTFSYDSIREFLTAYHIESWSDDFYKRCVDFSSRTHWHEVLLLMVGYQVMEKGHPEKPILLAEQLLKHGPIQQTLAGEILNLAGHESITLYDPPTTHSDGLWSIAIGRLLTIATEGKAPEVPVLLRVRAGQALGALCYRSLNSTAHSDAPSLPPDRRLPLAVIGLASQNETWWLAAFDTYWCQIEAEPFWHGDDRTMLPLRHMRLPYTYKIARYPLTNVDYQRFVDDQGYTTQYLWTPEGWDWLRRSNVTKPRWFEDPQYNGFTQPVIGISWYEAAAYCTWLKLQGHQAGWLPDTSELRLPTWLEWERTARHTDERRHPWGSTGPDSENVNYRETGIGVPTPIGCFPRGMAVCGATDMVGNIIEWTSTPYDTPEEPEAQKDFTSLQTVLVASSDFRSEKDQLCCGSSDGAFPYHRLSFSGFRVVWFPEKKK